jgi:CRISPR/Cas system endoribonuclease Cas6 (RAMP superfamily)
MFEIKIYFKKINFALPYTYYDKLHGFICQLMGDNNYGKCYHHYLASNLCGGEFKAQGITFKDKPFMLVRIDKNDDTLKVHFIQAINTLPKLYIGDDILLEVDSFTVNEVTINKNVFNTSKYSPILTTKKYSKFDKVINMEIAKKDTELHLLKSIQEKAKECEFEIDPDLSITILQEYNKKIINYRGIYNTGRIFKLLINANYETIKFIMLNGLGRSAGCQFGYIY